MHVRSNDCFTTLYGAASRQQKIVPTLRMTRTETVTSVEQIEQMNYGAWPPSNALHEINKCYITLTELEPVTLTLASLNSITYAF